MAAAQHHEASAATDDWETVVGLEVHVELATDTKLFSAAPSRFGDEPNTNVTPVCLGLPGSLPVLNRRAVELAIAVGLALNCEIRPSIFHRKNYFYPDMPKDYQVSQYDQPICSDGWLDVPGANRVGIERAHLEEDAGKTTHLGGADGRIHGAVGALVDYNRAGTPLLEIVSRPDIGSAAEASAYVEELRAILLALGASDARLEEGSMRVDANISVRPVGSDELRTRCEVKNVNSLRSLRNAIDYEARRHIGLYQSGEEPIQETRHWSTDGRTHSLRSKEEADDYRYFPEPDLVPLAPDPEWISRVRAAMPVLPAAQRERLGELGADLDDAQIIVNRGLASLVLDAVGAGADANRTVMHAVQNLALDGAELLDATQLASLVQMEAAGQLTATQAKTVLGVMCERAHDGNADPGAIAAELGFEAMDSSELETLVDQAIADNPEAWRKFCAGEAKVSGVFVGAVMKATRGQADGKAVNQLLAQRRDGRVR
ncbi:Asp-tRNA(Asn)/Glu-tRNA(Gln) amidotransferase subunit GatB [Candidatus Poriferisodalis sp.]|uniref:Asp-tRNA(Asn)/Glu-tRNA(Gln) amidotransferase subunit GatB n=1 Tax=Candidatus Poriferisodalis sp. TaxID=3101277 RepID=UPI003B02951E